jgi:hypothetical protein
VLVQEGLVGRSWWEYGMKNLAQDHNKGVDTQLSAKIKEIPRLREKLRSTQVEEGLGY